VLVPHRLRILRAVRAVGAAVDLVVDLAADGAYSLFFLSTVRWIGRMDVILVVSAPAPVKPATGKPNEVHRRALIVQRREVNNIA
jgi:hypothetical protein